MILNGSTRMIQEYHHAESCVLTCTNEAVARDLPSGSYRLQKKAILSILGYPQIGYAWCYKITRQFDIHRYAVPSLLLEDNLLYGG